MVSLIVAFFVISPTLILHTAGYSIDLQNKRIIRSGVLSIDALPNDAEVYLNNKQIKKSLPLWLPNSLPNAYNIRIQKAGFHSWEKDIILESQKTYYIRDVELYKQSEPELLYKLDADEGSVDFSPEGKAAIIVAFDGGSADATIKLLDLKSQNLKKLFEDTIDSHFLEIQWNETGTRASISFESHGQTKLALIDVESMSARSYSFSQIHTLKFQGNTLYLQEGQRIIEILKEATFFARLADDTTSWYIDSSGVLWQTNGISITNAKNQFNSKTEIGTFLSVENSDVYTKENGSIKHFILSDNIAKLNYSYGFEYFVKDPVLSGYLTLSSLEANAISPSNGLTLLSRFSRKYNNIFRQNTTGDYIVSNQNEIVAFNAGYGVTTQLLSADISGIAHSPASKKLYFWGSKAPEFPLVGIYSLSY